MNYQLPPHFLSLASSLVGLFGPSTKILSTDRLTGGDINKAYGLTLSNGSHVFMKANAKDKVTSFTFEAAGLSAISSTKTLSTPKVLCTGTDDGEEVGYSFMLMDFVESKNPRTDYWEVFGRELAAMHQASTESFTNAKKGEKAFGFYLDNFIGMTSQKNSVCPSWVSFFRDYRLAPQFKAADKNFDKEDRVLITKLLDHLDEFLVDEEKPALVHGDLWSGNVLCGPDGKAWLIDPAVYVGNREVDIAMTELFGGFPASFYQSYREAYPLQAGYEERRDLYNLYQLLNHLNMFGPTYLEPVRAIVSEYVG